MFSQRNVMLTVLRVRLLGNFASCFVNAAATTATNSALVPARVCFS